MIRAAVTGAAGRMGKMLIEAIYSSKELTLTAAFEQPGLSVIGADAGDLCGLGRLGVVISEDIKSEADKFDVLIDFSTPQSSMISLSVCESTASALVVGTTGFSEDDLILLDRAATKIPVVMAPNMSVGVNILFKLVEAAAASLGDNFDVEVIEAHHRDKIDAPSGTAVRIGEILAGTMGRNLETDAIYGRQGAEGPRKAKTIGFETIRGGDIVGDHTVLFAGEGERLEITHRAQSRMNFAQGALRAAIFASNMSSGRYDMQDVLGLKG